MTRDFLDITRVDWEKVLGINLSHDATDITGETIYPDGGRRVLNYTVPVKELPGWASLTRFIQTVWKLGLMGFTNRGRHSRIGHGAHFRL